MMASELVINVTYSETRIAFLENGTLVEFFIEKKNDHSMVGSIYKGKVVRIVPGMDAAFIDIGLEKSAFLYVGDIILDRGMYEEFDSSDFHFEVGERIEGVLEDGQERQRVHVGPQTFGGELSVFGRKKLPGRAPVQPIPIPRIPAAVDLGEEGLVSIFELCLENV